MLKNSIQTVYIIHEFQIKLYYLFINPPKKINFLKKYIIFFTSKVLWVKVKVEKLTDLQGNLFFVLFFRCVLLCPLFFWPFCCCKKTMKAYSLYSITKDQELLFYSHCNNQHNHGLTILLLFCFMVLPCKASYIIIVIYLPGGVGCGQLAQGPRAFVHLEACSMVCLQFTCIHLCNRATTQVGSRSYHLCNY